VLADVLEYLRCPVCGEALSPAAGSLRCASGHTHDVAREGYVNLLGGHRIPRTADTREMVGAREAFLARGFYEPIAQAVAGSASGSGSASTPGCFVEVGAGTGYYLAAALDQAPARVGIALDISKHAARRAARSHARAGAVVCDVWQPLPLADGCAAVVIDVFAPRNASEIARILSPGAVLVVVTPTGRHLRELIPALGLVSVDAEKERRLGEQLGGLFEPVASTHVVRELSLDRSAVSDLVRMGPSSRHVAPSELDARIGALSEPIPVSLDVTVATYRRVRSPGGPDRY
jgi:23S rRNA (guanine745-N1)-methyltransferase